MTFLEFILTETRGPCCRRRGENRWLCPFCQAWGLTAYPPEVPYKDRWTCRVCRSRGDWGDLLGWLYPGDDFSRKLDRLRALWRDYQRRFCPADDCELQAVIQARPLGESTRTTSTPFLPGDYQNVLAYPSLCGGYWLGAAHNRSDHDIDLPKPKKERNPFFAW